MDVPETSDKTHKKLNNAVAISVVIFSVFTAFTKIKDDNIVQAMQASKADAVDTWNEYQSARIKQHLAESDAILLRANGDARGEEGKAALERVAQDLSKYIARTKDLSDKAKSYEKQYEALNFRDDQFDISDALMAVSISLAAIASLVELWWLLGIAWGAGILGMAMGIAGFAGWTLHPDLLVRFLS